MLNTAASIATASVAACTAVLFSNMFETIKTRLQLDGEGVKSGGQRQYRNVVDAFTKIYRLEGVRGLQAGLTPALAYQAVMNGTRLGLYDPIQRLLRAVTGADKDSSILKIVSGAGSGAIGAALGSPLYLVKNRLQAQSKHFAAKEQHNYGGMVDGLRRIYTQEGVRGLLRGIDGAVPRVMVGSATQLSTYDAAKRWSAAVGVPDGMSQHLAASMLASVITVTMMNPFDVISTRLYQSAGKGTHYTGPIDCFQQTVRTEGWRALQKGWLAQYARLGPHTVLTFLILEQVRPVALAIPFCRVQVAA